VQQMLLYQISLVRMLVAGATNASYSNFFGQNAGLSNWCSKLKFLWSGAGYGATSAKIQISLVRVLVLVQQMLIFKFLWSECWLCSNRCIIFNTYRIESW
jgi:hypothetical protein